MGKFGNNWVLKLPPELESRRASEKRDYERIAGIQYAPVVESRLSADERREIQLQVENSSMLLGSVRWIGTNKPLKVGLALDELSLATGTGRRSTDNRGRCHLQVQTIKGGLATLSVTNTSGTTVKVRLVLGAIDLIHGVR